jgi:hypothetical protein
MIGELRLATVLLEGEIFKLNVALDKELNLNKYCNLKKEIEKKQAQHIQYRNMMDEFEKLERLKTVKRKMRK